MSGIEKNPGKADGQNGRLGGELKHQLSDAGQMAKDKLSNTAKKAGDRARNFAAEQKSVGADQVLSLAGAVHTAARELEQEMPQASSLIHQAAQGMERAATALRERNINQLMNDVRDLAQRQPWLFFGGALLAGFALTRFVRSSAEEPRSADASTSYPSGRAQTFDTRIGDGSWRAPSAPEPRFTEPRFPNSDGRM